MLMLYTEYILMFHAGKMNASNALSRVFLSSI